MTTGSVRTESERKVQTMIHEIKILTEIADYVLSGDKTFEVRKNDRGYQRGDVVRFKTVREGQAFLLPEQDHPLNGKEYTITYVLSGWGIKEGYVVFGIKPKMDGDGDNEREKNYKEI